MKKLFLCLTVIFACLFSCTITDDISDHKGTPIMPYKDINCYKYNVDGTVDIIPCPPK